MINHMGSRSSGGGGEWRSRTFKRAHRSGSRGSRCRNLKLNSRHRSSAHRGSSRSSRDIRVITLKNWCRSSSSSSRGSSCSRSESLVEAVTVAHDWILVAAAVTHHWFSWTWEVRFTIQALRGRDFGRSKIFKAWKRSGSALAKSTHITIDSRRRSDSREITNRDWDGSRSGNRQRRDAFSYRENVRHAQRFSLKHRDMPLVHISSVVQTASGLCSIENPRRRHHNSHHKKHETKRRRAPLRHDFLHSQNRLRWLHIGRDPWKHRCDQERYTPDYSLP